MLTLTGIYSPRIDRDALEREVAIRDDLEALLRFVIGPQLDAARRDADTDLFDDIHADELLDLLPDRAMIEQRFRDDAEARAYDEADWRRREDW